jgi:dTDP-4-amino-4,6-dideoxygalactose transaminase
MLTAIRSRYFMVSLAPFDVIGQAAEYAPDPMRVPFFRYGDMFAMFADDYRKAMDSVLERGAYILQKENTEFDKEFARFIGVEHSIGVGNGTDAIMLALRAADVGPGDEVILPSHTYIATAASVHFVGATPVLVECGSDHLIDPDAVAAAIGPRTRCIMPVQLNGRTAQMDRLMALAEQHDLVIVEDAAQGVGSRFRGQSAGTFGVAGTYSFYPAKVLGCFGDGGAVVTNSGSVASTLRLLRDHGRNDDGRVVAWGINSRLDNLQAAVLLARLRHVDDEIRRRREIAQMYQDGLGDVTGLVLPPAPDADADHFDVYQNYEIESDRRDDLRSHLSANGVGTLIQWAGTPIHQFEELKFDVDLPRTDELFRRCMLLPMNSMVRDDEVEIVVSEIRSFYGQ